MLTIGVILWGATLGAAPDGVEAATALDVAPDFGALASAQFAFEPAQPEVRLALWGDGAQSAGDNIESATPPFGQADSVWWIVNATGGSDFMHDQFGRFGGGVSYFIAADISLDFEFNFMYFHERDGEAYAGNFNLITRWHFLHDESRSWTMYGDVGAGILWASRDVPENGSRFNFTPQAGMGLSFDIGNDVRLYIGARWHHVSNARLYENNPGREYGMIYTMLSWPF